MWDYRFVNMKTEPCPPPTLPSEAPTSVPQIPKAPKLPTNLPIYEEVLRCLR